jgi:hypothetical protein
LEKDCFGSRKMWQNIECGRPQGQIEMLYKYPMFLMEEEDILLLLLLLPPPSPLLLLLLLPPPPPLQKLKLNCSVHKSTLFDPVLGIFSPVHIFPFILL